MKVLESQNALLSNYEVYQHTLDQRRNNKANNRRVPANAHKIMNEVSSPNPLTTLTSTLTIPQVMTYLTTKPSPLANQEEKQDYTPEAIPRLLERLREADLPGELTKGELLSILNLRPSSSALLSTAIEDMEERFSEDEQNRIVDVIAEVLGRSDPAEADGEGELDGEGEAEAVPSVENGC
ncbi:hypothetical protein VTJ49DRAFT_3547 [Mycothermus thermophilus]|uniref:DNA-directed RNA polymerase III subunit RPC9 n=1 Tax=Humicola insolens TaxID=85995 RepID=A0ABR3V976_HUMIN